VSPSSVAIVANAATFLASAIAIAAIPASDAFSSACPSEAETPSLLADIRAGARALRSRPVAIRLVAADVLCSGVYGLLTVTLVLVGRGLGAAGSGYGILLAGIGAGGVLGAIISGRASAPSSWRRTLTLALLAVGAALPALGITPSLTGDVAFALLCGGGMVVSEVLSETALPRMLSADQLGPAYGLVLPTSLGGVVAGSLIGGPLVSQFGLEGAMTAAGMCVLVTAALLVRRPFDGFAGGVTERVDLLETAAANG
jgi:predicted MFS family arabinose efflux permease